jgi:hypothetical protein
LFAESLQEFEAEPAFLAEALREVNSPARCIVKPRGFRPSPYRKPEQRSGAGAERFNSSRMRALFSACWPA